MRSNKVSLRAKVFGYLAAFVALLLALLWVMQIVLLEDFYKAIKISAVKDLVSQVERNLGREDLEAWLRELAFNNSAHVRIVDAAGQDVLAADMMPNAIQFEQEELAALYARAEAASGMLAESYDDSTQPGVPPPEPQPDGRTEGMRRFPRGAMLFMLCAKITDMPGQGPVMVLVNAMITPVNTTVETLRLQLAIVTAVMLLVAAGLALLIARRVAKPITGMNHAAKALAKGRYDITFEGKGFLEIEELSQTLNYAARELSKVDGLRRELMANISHDLRTPLTLITGYAEVMRDLPGENTPENVQVIIDEATHLSQLVSDILDISKLEAGAQPLTLTTVDLTGSIRAILRRYTKLTEQEGYCIRFASAGEAMVRADELRISQVIYNLINNAVSYTGPDKTIWVRQRIQQGWVRVEVADSGPGIDQADLPYIWDRYYKADRTHRRAIIGTGLGLSIVKNILELHGAQYGVQSGEGGSVFWFALPLLAQAGPAVGLEP